MASHLPPPENRGGGAAATAFQHRGELRVDGARAAVEELQRGHCLIGCQVVDDSPWQLLVSVPAGRPARPAPTASRGGMEPTVVGQS